MFLLNCRVPASRGKWQLCAVGGPVGRAVQRLWATFRVRYCCADYMQDQCVVYWKKVHRVARGPNGLKKW